ncbi:Uma2 family endonuclease [Caldithrix abyssi]|nr:Uma2 family endonuclease [Caldithrix abyssi]
MALNSRQMISSKNQMHVMKVKETASTYKAKSKPLTYQEYLKLPDDGQRYEVINGELIMTPSHLTIHQQISDEIFLKLGGYVKQKILV